MTTSARTIRCFLWADVVIGPYGYNLYNNPINRDLGYEKGRVLTLPYDG